MIRTSYFSINANHPDAVSISLYSPDWFHGEEYTLLTPQREMFRMWKDHPNLGNDWYRDQFYKTTLINLDVHKVARDMEGKVMLCYEKSGDFCHRHLVADWLRDAGYEVEEIKYEKKSRPKAKRYKSLAKLNINAVWGHNADDAVEFGLSSY